MHREAQTVYVEAEEDLEVCFQGDSMPNAQSRSSLLGHPARLLLWGIIAGVGLLVLCFCAAFWMGRQLGSTDGTRPSESGGDAASNIVSDPSASTTLLVVDVHGDVTHPGVYRLPTGTRVQDAVSSAGGFLHSQDAALMNLAEPLDDGMEVLVPDASHVEQPSSAVQNSMSNGTGGSGPEPNPMANRVDLNTADAATLQTVPGIGPSRAKDIVAYRNAHGPFHRMSDLHNIRGIGEKTLAKLEPYLYITTPTAPQ